MQASCYKSADLDHSECLPRCRIKVTWADAGKEGFFIAAHRINGMWWGIVQWDGENDPDIHKMKGIEVAELKWRCGRSWADS